jgi:hypothetical protein
MATKRTLGSRRWEARTKIRAELQKTPQTFHSLEELERDFPVLNAEQILYVGKGVTKTNRLLVPVRETKKGGKITGWVYDPRGALASYAIAEAQYREARKAAEAFVVESLAEVFPEVKQSLAA